METIPFRRFQCLSSVLLVWICVFLPLRAASISGITPPLGHPGDVIQIRGSGFDTNASNDVVRFGPNRAAVLSATVSQLTVQVPVGQPLGPAIVSLNGVNGPTFITSTNAKIASIPPNPVAGCQGCTCASCGCQDANSSPCVSQGAYLGGAGGSIYGERGEFFQSVTDLIIPGRPGASAAVQYKVQRQYRSAANNNGSLGNKWDFSYAEGLTLEPDGSIIDHNGLGRYDRYLLNNQGNFVAAPEFYTTLVRNPDGSYTLTFRDRTVKEFDKNGRLTEIEDRNGNSLQFTYNSQGELATVTDSLGRPITYTYDGAGHLTHIADFDGRAVSYAYDSNGNLASVTSPAVTGTPNGNDFPSGKTTRYTYDSNHNLLTITRPNETAGSGPAVLQNTYNASGQITSQTYGGTNASGIPGGGTYTYTYTPLNAGVTSADPNLPVMRTQQTDRDGNVTQYDYNRLGYPVAKREYTRGIRPGDPSDYVTSYQYNADGRMLQTTLPHGNVMQYTYDEGNPDRFQQGNMLSATELPDTGRGGDQSFITTTYTYEPLFNHISTMTEPRGNDPSYVPQNGGTNSPGRYTTTYSYDAAGNLLEKVQPTVILPTSMPQSIITDYTYNQFGQLTSLTDPEGNVTQYTYYVMNDPGNMTGGYLKETVEDATTSGRRTETTTPLQITTQYFYDAVGNMVRTIDGRGNDTLSTYNQLNEVVETQTEAPYRYTTYTFYDANDNVVQRNIENQVVVETGGKPTFVSGGNFTTQDSTPSFFINRYTYDILDRVVTEDLDATGSTPARDVTQYRYDPNENRISETQPAGNVTRTFYDERDLAFTVTRGYGNPAASTTEYDYDLNRNLSDTVDGRGFKTLYMYDGFDRRTEMIDAVGGQVISHYDPAGNVISTSILGQPGGPSPANNSGAGNVTLNLGDALYDELSRRYQYDENPVNGTSFVPSGVTTTRPPSVTTGPLNPGHISSQALYDRNGRVVQTTGDDLAVTSSQYDGLNRRVMVTDPQGNTIQYSYDADNNIIQTVETDVSQISGVANEQITTSYQFDAHNRPTSSTDNCQNTRHTAYDSRDNVTEVTDAKGDSAVGCSGTVNAQGNSMRYFYDGMSRQIQSVQDLRTGGVGSNPIDTTNAFNPGGQITATSVYDGNGRITNVTDSNGNTTQYQYDALNRKTAEILADGTTTATVYDPNDNAITVTDNNGTVQSHTYDAVDRRIQTAVTPAAGVIGTTANTYQYDGLSRMTKLTDNNDPTDTTSASTVTEAYDSLGRIIESTQNGKAIDSAWTAQQRRTGLAYPNGRQLNYTYDSLERVQTIQDSGALTNLAQYSYIGARRVLQRQYQNGTQLTYLDNTGTTDIGYDALRRTIQRRDVGSGNSLLVGFSYAYDRENNKSYESKQHSTANSELYTYDSAYRITDFARGQLNGANTAIPSPSSTQDWTLDGLGNWRVNLINGLAQNRSVSNTNEYRSIAGPGASSDTESYDNDGNLLLSTGQALAYQWDYRSRLREVCSLSGTATHCTDSGASVLAVYSYDAMNRRTRKVVTNSGALNGTTSFYYDGGQSIEEHDGTDTETQQFVYGIYVDEPLVLDQAGGARYFYHQNTLYSTFALTDSTGALAEGYQYDAYGAQTVFGPDFTTVLGTASAVGNPYLYTGQRFDPETGLYYYKSRYYSTALGRFISRDAYREADINLYEYVVDRPTALVDPYGDKAKDCAKNIQPKKVVLNSGDQGSEFKNLAYSLKRSETTFKDVAKRISAQVNANCECIVDLILQAHSNPGWFDLRGRRFKQRLNAATGKMVDTQELEGFNDVAVTDGDDPQKYTRLVAENTEKFVEILREKVCFCKPCRVWLLGCNVGLGDIPEKMQEATKCTVYAPKGYINQTADPSRPASLEKSITIRREGDFTPYPNAEAKFGVFPPPPEKKK